MRRRSNRLEHPLGVSILAISILLLPGVAGAFCRAPTFEVDEWRARSAENFCQDQAEAEKYCKVWFKQCKKRVKAAAKCQIKESKTRTPETKARCQLPLWTGDPKLCAKSATTLGKEDRFVALLSLDIALEDCEQYVPNCINKCRVP